MIPATSIFREIYPPEQPSWGLLLRVRWIANFVQTLRNMSIQNSLLTLTLLLLVGCAQPPIIIDQGITSITVINNHTNSINQNGTIPVQQTQDSFVITDAAKITAIANAINRGVKVADKKVTTEKHLRIRYADGSYLIGMKGDLCVIGDQTYKVGSDFDKALR